MSAKNSFTGLNPNLICAIYPMKRIGDGTEWARDYDHEAFEAPLTQASLDMAVTWQSPFEGSGVESRFPALAQMAQAGLFSGTLQAVGHALPKDLERTQALISDLDNSAKKLVGKSGLTKLNSHQVFSGMPPVKIQVTAFLRAFRDSWREVEEPLKKLQEWTLPQELARDGVAAEFIKSGADVLALMPSKVPQIVGITYKTRIVQPCVIEAISDPWDAPIDRHGYRISASVQITLCTLTALDRRDWGNTYVETGRMYF